MLRKTISIPLYIYFRSTSVICPKPAKFVVPHVQAFISDACDAMPSAETCGNALKRHFKVDHSYRVQVVCLGMNVFVDKRGEPTLSCKTDDICPTKASRLPVTETANTKPPKTSIHGFISGVTKSQYTNAMM